MQKYDWWATNSEYISTRDITQGNDQRRVVGLLMVLYIISGNGLLMMLIIFRLSLTLQLQAEVLKHSRSCLLFILNYTSRPNAVIQEWIQLNGRQKTTVDVGARQDRQNVVGNVRQKEMKRW